MVTLYFIPDAFSMRNGYGHVSPQKHEEQRQHYMAGYCQTNGGQCVSSPSECDFHSHVYTGRCDASTFCCVPMQEMCETQHDGFCASSPSQCYNKQGYYFYRQFCGEDTVCCLPAFEDNNRGCNF